MKLFTQIRLRLSENIRCRIMSGADPQLRFSLHKNQSIRRIAVVFFILISSFFQMSFAAGPVTGRVTDDKAEPLVGVTVQVKGEVIAVATGADGRFSINVPEGRDTLVFSFIGFTDQEVAINGRTSININLVPESKTLSDVVVVGYGRQRKVNLVGSVAVVNVDEKMTSRALSNISSGLSGLVPGLAVIQSQGMAGNNSASLIIRGLGTANNANPLVVVDGMPDVDINRININDIESISVLKDATSASVYGSRAANGVILITTKSGRGQRRTTVTFTSNASVTVPTNSLKFMADYPRALTLHQRRAAVNTLPSNQLFRNGTIDQWMALGMIDPVRYPNTDWWDVVLRDGSFQSYNLSASGGNDAANFFISVGLRDEKGLQINNDYKQYNARFNFDYKLKHNMNTGIRFNGNWSNFIYALEDGFTESGTGNTAALDMQYSIAGILPYDPKTGYYGGVMAYSEDPQAYNPYTVYQNTLNRQNRQELNGSIYYDWTPVKGLTARVDYALNYYNQFRWNANTPNQAFNFQTGTFGSRVYVGPNAGAGNFTNNGYKTLLNGRLNYQKKFGENHDFNVLGVYSEEYWYDRSQSSSRNDRLHPSLTDVNAALTQIQSAGGGSSAEGLRSYIGRLNYTGFGKYLFEANVRVDGSSKFLEGSRFGVFPSVALGWRFTEEAFINKFTDRFLNNGKLRVSYGSLGNNSGVGRYEQLKTLLDNHYMIGGNIVRGFVNNKMINRFLTWETTTVFNVGMDLGFFNERLTTSIDYYDRLTTDMNRPSDMSIFLAGAYQAPRTNIGDMRNRGIEGDFTWRDRIGKLNYGISVNASYNRSTLEKWNEPLSRGAANSGNNVFLNMPYGYVYAYEAIGIAQTWQDVYNATPQGAQPGDVLIKDLNGDGRITGDDRKAYKNIQANRPTTFYGFNANFAWKGIDLAFLFQGSAGRKDYWLNNYNNTNFGASRYASTWSHWYNPWNHENRDGEWPRLGGSGNNRDESTYWLQNMSYLRLKNIQLGYSLPKKLLSRLHVSNLRIVGTAENLVTFSSYKGLDPEKAGDDNNVYPINKSYSIAFNLSF